jgi:hypothetical protein
MSRVDEALERAAALSGNQAADPFPQGHEFTPANAADLWPEETAPEEPGFEQIEPAPIVQPVPDVGAATEMDEKLVSRLLDTRSVEQYRRLAARLHLVQAQRGIKVVMISSALPGEGRPSRPPMSR